jgi:hypothetical protein
LRFISIEEEGGGGGGGEEEEVTLVFKSIIGEGRRDLEMDWGSRGD